jgi:outer membrane protein OmpA-like peptidoglycan-associated protein
MKNTFALIYTIIFIFYFQKVFTQNLVPNPSFEDLTTCELYFDHFNTTKNWKGYNFTPDIFNSCAKTTFVGVPNNVFDRQIPAQGKGYAGLLTYHRDFQNELIGAKLLQPLQKGKKYQVSFKVSRAFEHAQFATNNLGALFTNEPEKAYNSAKVHIVSAEVVEESNVWQTIQGVVLAEDNFQYIVLGNFFSSEYTELVRMNSGSFEAAYYFIDEVSVTPAKEDAPITPQYTPKYIGKKVRTLVKTEKTNPADAIVKNGIAIAGKILDAETKKPIVAVVEFSVPDTQYRLEHETDYLTGNYAFANIPRPETFALKITARNYYAVIEQVKMGAEARVRKDYFLYPLKAGQSIELKEVSFEDDEDIVHPESFSELNRLIQVMRDSPTMKVELAGYTNDKNELELARQRANAIKKHLVEIGEINPDRIKVGYYYQSNPNNYVGNAADENKRMKKIVFKILN